MKIFVDFDNTIFNTRHIFLDMLFQVFENYGVSRNDFDDTLPYFSGTALQGGECYSPASHIRIIKEKTGKNIDEKVFIKEMNVFLEDLEEHVFDEFYQFVNSFDKDDLIVLSYGEYNFQKDKISGSGVSQFFVDTIITQSDKTGEIEKYIQNFPGETAVLIDDKQEYFESAKKSDIDIKTVHILRDGRKCDNGAFCDYCVDSLAKISGILNE